jgi:hypothetical protein
MKKYVVLSALSIFSLTSCINLKLSADPINAYSVSLPSALGLEKQVKVTGSYINVTNGTGFEKNISILVATSNSCSEDIRFPEYFSEIESYVGSKEVSVSKDAIEFRKNALLLPSVREKNDYRFEFYLKGLVIGPSCIHVHAVIPDSLNQSKIVLVEKFSSSITVKEGI